MTTTTAYREKFITVNNVRLRYLDWGTRGKTPLICMHGHAGRPIFGTSLPKPLRPTTTC